MITVHGHERSRATAAGRTQPAADASTADRDAMDRRGGAGVVPLSPLECPAWLEFNAWRTGLKPLPYRSVGPDGSLLRAVLYLDRRGRVRLPPSNPYLPLVFRSVHGHPTAQTARWLEAAGALAETMRTRGTANQLYLSPDATDMRPWMWRGFVVGPRYTYCVDLPYDRAMADRGRRRALDKAAARGFTVERIDDVGIVLACLADVEQRQGFTHSVGRRELTQARSLLGDDAFRAYAVLDAGGRPAYANVTLHAPGARAIAWVAGARSAYLADGVDPLGLAFVFDDLAAAGATGVDLCGANIPTVAGYKSHWGARLVMNFGVRTHSLRTAARFAADWRAAWQLAHPPGSRMPGRRR